jgi:peptidoglycan-associated lipoprotein
MRIMRRCILSFAFVVAVGMGFSACRAKRERYTGVDRDFINTVPLPDRVEGGDFFGSSVKRGQYQPVYFSFDSFALSGAEQGKVRDIAASIRGSHSKMLIVAGFTDSRGTEEYNRALGERRANTVRQALISSGVRADRLQTVSFGEEMPIDSRDNETAWAKNRRVEIGALY